MKDFPVSRANCTFRIIQGTKNVFKFAIMLFDSAEKDIDIAIKGNEITRWIIESVDDSLQKKTSKQVNIHVISESDNHNIVALQRFLEFSDLRYVSPLNTVPLLLIDGKEVLICLNGNKQGIPENAIWTNHPEFVGMLTGFFNIMWGNGKIQKTKS